jgi:hypothetical protein
MTERDSEHFWLGNVRTNLTRTAKNDDDKVFFNFCSVLVTSIAL